MKKTVLIGFGVIVALLFSCKKEDRFYNDDGSPITMEQALEIVKDKVDYYTVRGDDNSKAFRLI